MISEVQLTFLIASAIQILIPLLRGLQLPPPLCLICHSHRIHLHHLLLPHLMMIIACCVTVVCKRLMHSSANATREMAASGVCITGSRNSATQAALRSSTSQWPVELSAGADRIPPQVLKLYSR